MTDPFWSTDKKLTHDFFQKDGFDRLKNNTSAPTRLTDVQLRSDCPSTEMEGLLRFCDSLGARLLTAACT
jgi:hypothetical protein